MQSLLGNEASRVLANVTWGKDVESTADLSTKPSVSPLPGGQAFPDLLLYSTQRRSKAGQELCWGRGFSHGTEMRNPSGGIPWQHGRAPWKQRTGSTTLFPYTAISQSKHMVKEVQ